MVDSESIRSGNVLVLEDLHLGYHSVFNYERKDSRSQKTPSLPISTYIHVYEIQSPYPNTAPYPARSGELRHGTCHFYTIYTGISKVSSVYGNLKDQIELHLCICEALS